MCRHSPRSPTVNILSDTLASGTVRDESPKAHPAKPGRGELFKPPYTYVLLEKHEHRFAGKHCIDGVVNDRTGDAAAVSAR